jgi:hypothetical protein
VGFEPTAQVFEQAKTFHALDRAASVIGIPGMGLGVFLWSANRTALKEVNFGSSEFQGLPEG